MDDVPASLVELYEPADLRRLGYDVPAMPSAPRSRWRAGTVAGAMVASLVLGFRDVIEPERREREVEIEDWTYENPRLGITIHLVPDDPAASVFYLR